MGSAPKILLLGDYSNCHRTLASALRRLGSAVTYASDGCRWMDIDSEVDISRRSGKIGGAELYMRFLFGDLRRIFKGYDIVALNDINFVQLRPKRLNSLFKKLKKNNGAVFLTSMSTDIAYLDMVEPPESPLRYSEWFIGNVPSRHYLANKEEWNAWHSPELVKYQREALDCIDGAVSVLYEYHLAMVKALGEGRCAYGGIPVDTDFFSPVVIPEKIDKVRFFLGRDRTRKLMKGSGMLEIAARSIVKEMPQNAELEIAENLPFASFVNRLRNAHVVLDQIYSYTPATTALMAMSLGLNTVSGGESEYYDFIGEKTNRPIINAPVELEPLTDTLRSIVLNRHEIAERGVASREFVLKHNSADVVAKRFLDFWLSKL